MTRLEAFGLTKTQVCWITAVAVGSIILAAVVLFCCIAYNKGVE